MLAKVGRLFTIKTRFEVFLIVYALALGAVQRGSVYLTQYPGFGGKLLFLACTGAVFMAGAKMLDCIGYETKARAAAEKLVEQTSLPAPLPLPARSPVSAHSPNVRSC